MTLSSSKYTLNLVILCVKKDILKVNTTSPLLLVALPEVDKIEVMNKSVMET